jgi:dephospho-CoA kinase
MARSGLAPDEIERIMAQQASRLARLSVADAVILNQDLSLPELEAKVAQLAAKFGL